MQLSRHFPLLSPQVATMLLILMHAQHDDDDVRARDPYSRFKGRLDPRKRRPKLGEPGFRTLKHRP